MSGVNRVSKRGGTSQSRELTDPRTMRALTHPVRLALLEVLLLEGPLTATRASELISEPANTCSFHLRQLSKYGFVEEATPGPGRNRPWRLTTVGMHFSGGDAGAEATVAARGLERLLLERYVSRVQRFLDTRAAYSRQWRDATGASEFILHVSANELREVTNEISAVLDRFTERLEDATLRPSDSSPVEVLLFAYPVRPQSP
jgi:predicted ArsR family transcriptional regulator